MTDHAREDIAPRTFKEPDRRIRKGLILVYTGNGKGKSTAGFGAVFRALGRGFRVAVVQFIKGEWVSGEVKALERFGDRATYRSVGEGFTWKTQSLERDVACAERGWALCQDLLAEGRHDVYLFDEILYVLKYRFLSLETVLAGIEKKPERAHLILTGRDAPPAIVARADLVTEMTEIKHPYAAGIPAQPGIDY